MAIAFVKHPIHRQALLEHQPFPFGGHGQGIVQAPGAPVLGGALEVTAGFDQQHHRFHHLQHIALDEQLLMLSQSAGDGEQQGRLQHPPFVVLFFKPGVGKLDRNPLQLAWGQGR